jgi:hypothetical protein
MEIEGREGSRYKRVSLIKAERSSVRCYECYLRFVPASAAPTEIDVQLMRRWIAKRNL